MPKIIDVNKEEILDITKELIKAKEFSLINCRYIAKKAGIGVGTLYNFFESKFSILAEIILEDWINIFSDFPIDLKLDEGLKLIYQKIKNFSLKYNDLWTYARNESNEYLSYLYKHEQMTENIGNLINKLLLSNKIDIDGFTCNFIADNIIRYASKMFDYEKLEVVILKLLK